MGQNDYDLDKFFSYVFHSQKYRTKLEKSIENGLWEYATVLVWKTIILFIYEKLFQIKLVGNELPDAFKNQLQNANVTINNCFDFCCIPDHNIYTNLHRVWNNVEGNYKQLYNSLLYDRNSLSHVNRYEEDFNEQWFKTYFEKSLKLLGYLQELNNIQLSQKLYGFIKTNKIVQYFSEQDIHFLLAQESFEDSKIINYILEFIDILNYSDNLKSKLKQEVINSFLDSPTFALALDNGKRLIKLTNYYNEHEIKEILTGVINRQGTINQIVYSSGMEEIFETLFDDTTNIEGLENNWKDFIDELINIDEKRYIHLKEKFLDIYGEENVEE